MYDVSFSCYRFIWQRLGWQKASRHFFPYTGSLIHIVKTHFYVEAMQVFRWAD